MLLAGVNDRPEHARGLAALLGRRTALVNVIPYNPVAELPYQTPSAASVKRFVKTLEAAGINVFVRERKGDQIDAACGQLRRANIAAAVEQEPPLGRSPQRPAWGESPIT